jgi:predicted glutamine amidotransferase
MCRLFALSAAPARVAATFWLVDAPDSLAMQSRREPDGVGLGVFAADGTPIVHKRPVAAYEDEEFAKEAREVTSTTFLAHVRYASTGAVLPRNTHPFLQDGRLFAHNGVVEDLDRLRAKVVEVLDAPLDSLVKGDTDSELVFALITAYARRHGDVGRAIVDAVRWVAGELPLYALNVILTTPTDLWALRYPQTHRLWMLSRPPGGIHGGRHLDAASRPGTVRVRSRDLADAPATVVASERMDENPRWDPLAPGELLHVGPAQEISRRIVLDAAPARLLTLADLHPQAAASQTAATSG